MKIASTVLLIICVCTKVWSQSTYLDFKHKRVVRQNYQVFSMKDEVLFSKGENIEAELMDCVCQKPQDGELLIQFSKEFTTNDGKKYESLLIARLDYVIVKEVIQFRVPGVNQTIDRNAVSKFNLSLSSFNFERIDEIVGVAFFQLTKPYGLTGDDYNVAFRFRCKEGEISIDNL